MRTVLITSTYFSDEVFLGCLRVNALARYLPECGWRPIVLTPKLPTEPALPRDEIELIEYRDIRAAYAGWKQRTGAARQVKIEESGSGSRPSSPSRRAVGSVVELAKRVVVPDPSIVWWPFGTYAALRYLERTPARIDCVVTSSNPPTPHFIGASLKRRLGVPWVADFRDLWVLNHYWPWGDVRRSVEAKLERRLLASADAIVTLSDDYVARLRAFYGDDSDRYFVVPLGYDPGSVADPGTSLTDEFTITFTGNFVEGKRDPEVLFEGIRLALQRGGLERSRLRVRFYGPRYSWIDEAAAARGLADVVLQHGYVSHDEALRRQRESQILALFLWPHPAEAGAHSGKMEYLVARRPILVLTPPPGSIWEGLVRRSGAGETVQDADEVAAFLTASFAEYAGTGRVAYHGDPLVMEEFAYPQLARRFASVLERVTAAA